MTTPHKQHVGYLRSLAMRLSLAALALGLLLSLLISTIELWNEQEREIARVEQLVNIAAESARPAFVAALWAVDLKDAANTAEHIAKVPDIASVVVRKPTGPFVELGHAPAGARLYSYPLARQLPAGKLYELGTLEVSIDIEGIKARQLTRYWKVLGANVVVIGLVTALFLWLFEWQVTHHLRFIADFVTNLAPNDLQQKLQLKRRRSKPDAADELDLLVSGIQHMQDNLAQAIDTLEDKVSERTRELLGSKEAAEAANLAKSAFLASMSHELRTPLNAILGFSNLLRHEDNISPAQRKTLDLINRSGENLLNLINDVLDMSKIEAGNLVVENSAFDLAAMTADLIDLMRSRAEAKHLQLTLDPAAEFPRYICSDAAKLRQAVINLVGNAIKFTEQGGVTLRMNTYPTEQPQRLILVVEVQDSGVGISPDDQTRVFDAFVQVGQQNTQKGTGLGLSITRKFIELMGGELSLDSVVGEGSCFRIKLPVEATEETAIDTRSVAQARVIALAPGQPDYRILIVEDQMENWLLLQRLLERVGLSTRLAENGQLGVAAFESWRPHFIWMDSRMPVMNGIDATRMIRGMAGGQEVKIVAVTASAFKEERDQIMAAGMDDFVRKPYREDEIFDCLSRHLGLSFVREDDAEAVADDAAAMQELTPADFATLSSVLRESLRNAVVEMNQGKLSAVLADIAAHSPTLAAGVERMIAGFRFRELCDLLDAGEARP